MVNDENDKWADDGELPIRIVNSKNFENLSKRKTMNNLHNDPKESSTIEQINSLKPKDLYKNEHGDQIKNIELNKIPLNEKLTNEQEEQIKNIELNKIPINEKLTNEKLTNKDDPIKESEKREKEEYSITKSDIKNIIKLLQKIQSDTQEVAGFKKFPFDEKGREDIEKGKIETRKFRNYYDVYHTITTAAASDPNDFDSPVYNVERIFESEERYADILNVTNNGTDSLFVVISHGGRTNFSQEAIIFPGEVKTYYNVYELRLRSPTAGLPYRVTEYDINNVSETSFIPIEKANLHNQALPAIGTNWLASDITPTNSPTTFVVEVAVSIAGTFSAVITKGGNSQTVAFNVIPGPALIAGGLYIFSLLVHSGDSVNFVYSATGGTIQILRVQEFDGATA